MTDDAITERDRIAAAMAGTLDELLAIPPSHFSEADWLAFIAKLHSERAQLRLARQARRDRNEGEQVDA